MDLDFKTRLAELLAEFGMTQADLCRATGLKTSLVSNYATGKASPTLDTALLIASKLGITLDKLVGFKPKETLTEQEKTLLKMFRELDDNERQEILGYVEYKHAKKFLREQSSKEVGEKFKGA